LVPQVKVLLNFVAGGTALISDKSQNLPFDFPNGRFD